MKRITMTESHNGGNNQQRINNNRTRTKTDLINRGMCQLRSESRSKGILLVLRDNNDWIAVPTP